MRAKKPLYISLALMLLVSMTATMMGAKAWYPPSPPGTAVWVEPAVYNATANGKTVCDTFTVDVKIFNSSTTYGEGLWSLSFKLLYNDSLINATDVVLAGALSGRGDWYEATKSLTTGQVFYGGTLTSLPVLNIPGNDSLATVTFHIESQPTYPKPDASCVLNLTEVTLGVGAGVNPPASLLVVDGTYQITSTPPTPPVAIFTENATIAYINETISFDASSSYDPDGTITSYDWDFGDTNTGTGVTTTHAYDAVGTYTVNLTVTDNDGKKDWMTSTKTITEKPLGCFLDVFSSHEREYPQPSWTPYIGTKTDVPCDAFAPGENTTLYAKITFNDAPVNHLLVAFEGIFDPDNLTGRGPACQFYRTAETNKTGIAKISFRVPIPCEEDVMGKWLVTVTAKVQSVKQNDTMPFDVGYILSIAELSTNKLGAPETTFIREVDTIQVVVRVKNIAQIAKPVTVIAVLYDVCEVPLGQCIVQSEAAPGVYCSPAYTTFTPTIYVPQWAYVGAGKVYVSLFTAIPSKCGIPYCPEAETDIVITFIP